MPETSITSADTYALVVAVEHYREFNPNTEDDFHLNGPFADACSFVSWLRTKHNIPGKNITLLACPLKENIAPFEGERKLLEKEDVTVSLVESLNQEAFLRELSAFRGKDGSLLLFWSGHGIMSDKVRRPLFSTYTHKDRHTLNVTSLQQHLRTDEYKYPAEQVMIFDVCGTDFDRHWHQSDLPDNTFQNGVNCRPISQTLLFASQDGAVTQNDSSRVEKGIYYEQLQQALNIESEWPPNWERVHRLVQSKFQNMKMPDGTTQIPIRLRWESVLGVTEDLVFLERAEKQSVSAFWRGAVSAFIWACGCGSLLWYFVNCNLLVAQAHRPFEDYPLVAVGIIAAIALLFVFVAAASAGVFAVVVDSDYRRLYEPPLKSYAISPWALAKSWRTGAFLVLFAALNALAGTAHHALTSDTGSSFAKELVGNFAFSVVIIVPLVSLVTAFARLALISMASTRSPYIAWVYGFCAAVGIPLFLSSALMRIYAAIDASCVDRMATAPLLPVAATIFALMGFPSFILAMTLRRFQELCKPSPPSLFIRTVQSVSLFSYVGVILWYALLYGMRTSWSGDVLVMGPKTEAFSASCDLGPGWPDARHQSVSFTSQHLVRATSGPKNIAVRICDTFPFTMGHSPLMMTNSKTTLFVPKGVHYISTSNYYSTGAAKVSGVQSTIDFETAKNIDHNLSINGLGRGGESREFPMVATCLLNPVKTDFGWRWASVFGGKLKNLELVNDEKIGIYISPMLIRTDNATVGSASVDITASQSEAGSTTQSISFAAAPLTVVPICHDSDLWSKWYVVPNEDKVWRVELFVTPDIEMKEEPTSIEIVVGIVIEDPIAAVKVNQARAIIGKYMMERYYTGSNILRPLETAIGLMKAACARAPSNEAYKILYAEALILSEKYEAASSVLRADIGEGNALWHDLRAYAFYQRQDFPVASEAWQKTISINPRYFDLPDTNRFNTKGRFFDALLKANPPR